MRSAASPPSATISRRGASVSPRPRSLRSLPFPPTPRWRGAGTPPRSRGADARACRRGSGPWRAAGSARGGPWPCRGSPGRAPHALHQVGGARGVSGIVEAHVAVDVDPVACRLILQPEEDVTLVAVAPRGRFREALQERGLRLGEEVEEGGRGAATERSALVQLDGDLRPGREGVVAVNHLGEARRLLVVHEQRIVVAEPATEGQVEHPAARVGEGRDALPQAASRCSMAAASRTVLRQRPSRARAVEGEPASRRLPARARDDGREA